MRIARPKFWPRRARLLAVALAGALWAGGGLPATRGLAAPNPSQPAAVASSQEELIAAYLFNFTKYVGWPPSAVPPGAITVGVLGDAAVHQALQPLQGRATNGHALVVRWCADVNELGGANSVYLGAANEGERSALDTRFQSAPVLTVLPPGAVGGSAVIRLLLEQNKLRFEVDLEQSQRAGLTISSHLLRLARVRSAAAAASQAADGGQ